MIQLFLILISWVFKVVTCIPFCKEVHLCGEHHGGLRPAVGLYVDSTLGGLTITSEACGNFFGGPSDYMHNILLKL